MDDKVYITLEQLIDLEVCVGVRDDFEALFPEGRVEVTYENAEKYKDKFNFRSVAKRLLDRDNYDKWFVEVAVDPNYPEPVAHIYSSILKDCPACLAVKSLEAKLFVKHYLEQVLG